jgi:hypothetical protein
MNIPIYPSEINDGLEEQIQNNSVACLSVAEVELAPEQTTYQKLVAENSALADFFKDNDQAVAENRGQFDLYYMKSVLVSTGWNKNDDVFDPRETWEARRTAEDKPFNFMHDEKDIIGHITSNKVIDFDGNVIESLDIDEMTMPERFEIVTSSVIYTEWQDPEQKQRIQKILAGIEQGDWFVSMECLFPNFDYALIKGDEQKIIKRSEASAFLTKHLRSYGGDGKYEDYRVGRLLRNLAFSGKGLVSKPANPRSIILQGKDSTQPFGESIAQLDFNFTKPKENKMPNTDLEKQVSNLQAELVQANSANEALKDKVIAEQKAEYESQIEALATQVTESEETYKGAEATISDLNEKVVALEELVASKEKAMEDKDSELKAMKKKEAMMKRKAQLEEVGLDAEAASATMEDFADVDDSTFDKVVALMKKKAEMPDFIKKKMDDKKEDKKDDKKDGEAMQKGKYSEAEAVELEVEAKADEAAKAASEALETAEAPLENSIASSVDAGEEQASMRSSASAWIGSFIQTNNK